MEAHASSCLEDVLQLHTAGHFLTTHSRVSFPLDLVFFSQSLLTGHDDAYPSKTGRLLAEHGDAYPAGRWRLAMLPEEDSLPGAEL